jgi:hypothetical protein
MGVGSSSEGDNWRENQRWENVKERKRSRHGRTQFLLAPPPHRNLFYPIPDGANKSPGQNIVVGSEPFIANRPISRGPPHCAIERTVNVIPADGKNPMPKKTKILPISTTPVALPKTEATSQTTRRRCTSWTSTHPRRRRDIVLPRGCWHPMPRVLIVSEQKFSHRVELFATAAGEDVLAQRLAGRGEQRGHGGIGKHGFRIGQPSP